MGEREDPGRLKALAPGPPPGAWLPKGQRERVVSEKHLQGEFLLCCGYFSKVDKEHNKCGKMTYFVQKLTISPDAACHSGTEQVCETQQGGPVPNAQEESSVKADAFFPPACKPFSGHGVQLPPPYLDSLMPFPAVDISAEKGPQSEISSGLAGMFLSACGPLLPRPAALMRCCLGSFQL